MSEPRGVEERLAWMRDNEPGDPGWCAKWTWYACGGNQDPPNPPAWNCANANAVVDKARAAGVLHTDRNAPRGAIVLWTSDTHGHMALSKGPEENLDIMSTDPYGNWGTTGTMPQKWCEQNWGQKWAGWTTHYAGVDLPMGAAFDHGPVYLSKLVYGQRDSDSVRRLQLHLNGHPLQGGETLQVTGNYLDETDEEVRLCQAQHSYGSDDPGQSNVGPAQAAHLFTGCACVITDDRDITEPEEEPMGDYWYSGKPAGKLVFADSYKRLDVDKWAPTKDCIILSMLYMNVTGEGEFRVRLVRDPDDATAYQTFYAKAGDNFLLTHVWFEKAEANRRLWWEMCAMDAGQEFTVNTRYAKMSVVA
jgi:hypothetical protein